MPIRVQSVRLISKNPDAFTAGYKWTVTVDAQNPLPKEIIDVVFKWIADPKDKAKDILMDELEIGPIVAVGLNQFTLDCDAPPWRKIPMDQLLGNTGIIAEFSYRGNLFFTAGIHVRCSVRGEDIEGGDGGEEIPAELNIKDVSRHVMLEKHCATHHTIAWDEEGKNAAPEEEESSEGEDDEEEESEADDEEESEEADGEESGPPTAGGPPAKRPRVESSS